LQRIARKYLARAHFTAEINLRRRLREAAGSGEVAMIKALTSVQLQLLKDSSARVMGKSWRTTCKRECVARGPAQAMMLGAMGSRGQWETGSLSVNKIDNITLNKFVLGLQDFFLKLAAAKAAGSLHPEAEALGLHFDRGGKPRWPNEKGSKAESEATPGSVSGNEKKKGGDGVKGRSSVQEMSRIAQAEADALLSADTCSLFRTLEEGLTRVPLVRWENPSPAYLEKFPDLQPQLLSQTDLDILFSRSKDEDEGGGSTIGFFEFVEFLKQVGAKTLVYLPETKAEKAMRKRRKYWQNRVARFRQEEAEAAEALAKAAAERQALIDSGELIEVAPPSAGGPPSTPQGGSHDRRRRANLTDEDRSALVSRKTKRKMEEEAAAKLAEEAEEPIPRLEFINKPAVLFETTQLMRNEEESGLVWLVRMLHFAKLTRQPWALKVNKWLEEEASAVLGTYAARIQRMARIFAGRKFLRLLLRRNELEAEHAALVRNMVILQGFGRIVLARQRVMGIAVRFLTRYVPVDSAPYWHNPGTKVDAFTKPRALWYGECMPVRIPQAGMECIVPCCNCAKLATVNCRECDESFCKDCYTAMHCKGAMRQHYSEKVPVCSYCKFQCASKSCLTCFIAKPARGSVEEHMSGERGLYCDNCFIYQHDQVGKALEYRTDLTPKDRLKLLFREQHTSNITVVRQALQQPLITSHQYTNLIFPCEECGWRCAMWRCHDCNQVYCGRCLTGIHSVGGVFSRHKAEPLPYFTKDAYTRFESDAMYHKNKKKMDILEQKEAVRMLSYKNSMALRLQTWYRRVLGSRRGHAHMKSRRQEVREAWRLRKREDKRLRSSTSYAALDFLGLAPVLPSDTREEIVLQRLPYLSRRRAKEYIWQNRADWGFFTREQSGRKGVAPRDFAVKEHTDEELRAQGLGGGGRMPGQLQMRFGQSKHMNSVSLEGLVRRGEYMRVKTCIFCVLNVRGAELTLDRNWPGRSTPGAEVDFERIENDAAIEKRRKKRETDGNPWDEEEEEQERERRAALEASWAERRERDLRENPATKRGELLFRLPSYKGMRDRRYFKLRYQSIRLLMGNFVFQYYFRTHAAVCKSIQQRWRATAKKEKAKDRLAAAKSWYVSAAKWRDRATWAENFISTKTETVDLSKALTPEQIAEKKAEKERIAKLKKAQKLKLLEAKRQAFIDLGHGGGGGGEGQDGEEGQGEGFLVEGSLESESDEDDFEFEMDDDAIPEDDGLTPEEREQQRLKDNGEMWLCDEKERLAREAKYAEMTDEEIMLEDKEWEEIVDVLTENIMWRHRETNEKMHNEPRPTKLVREKKEREEKERIQYEAVNKRRQAQKKKKMR
jgi:hypothetical protein